MDDTIDGDFGDGAVQGGPRRRGPNRQRTLQTAGTLALFVFVVTLSDECWWRKEWDPEKDDYPLTPHLTRQVQANGPSVVGIAFGRYELLHFPSSFLTRFQRIKRQMRTLCTEELEGLGGIQGFSVGFC